jgi:DNA helicase II / ATP-dependent DNA helicase PcrA
MAWDSDLTDEQRKAAAHQGAHTRLLAGPGTGKTRALTRHAIFLVESEGVPPQQILVITFTRAATEELRNRLRAEFGEGAKLPLVSTLHSFALKTVLANSARVRLPAPIRIADDYEERHIIQEDLKAILRLEKIKEVATLLNLLSADWERLIPDWEKRFPNPEFLGAWQEHRKIFGYTLRSELVYQLKLAFTEGKLKLKDPPKYLLVDEYQDLNACDLAVIKEIAEAGAELFTAGDDDQSIYGFRFADPEGIRRFPKDYKPSDSLELAECKRCDCNILNLALYVARQDPRRIEKKIHAVDGAGPGEVRILHFENQDEEARAVAEICQWLRSEQNVRPDNILFLLRSDYNGQFSKPIRRALEAKGFRVATIINPLDPLNCPKGDDGREQKDGRILLSLLRLRVDEKDHLAWRTLLQLRPNGIGEKAYFALYELARQKGVGFADALMLVRDDPCLIDRFGKKLSEEVAAVQKILADIPNEEALPPLEVVRRLGEQQIAEKQVRDRVVGVFEKAAAGDPPDNMSELLRIINIAPDEQNQLEPDAINVMSMHQAKGLTADVTFVIAAEEEYLPGRASGADIDDERRLLYVSLTRAWHFLFITHCRRRTGAQRHSGSRSGQEERNLTPFLRGGPVQSESGSAFTRGLK